MKNNLISLRKLMQKEQQNQPPQRSLENIQKDKRN